MIKSGVPRHRAVLAAGVLLVASVVMVSTLFGMGRPPQDPAVYLAARGDQQLRYMALKAIPIIKTRVEILDSFFSIPRSAAQRVNSATYSPMTPHRTIPAAEYSKISKTLMRI